MADPAAKEHGIGIRAEWQGRFHADLKLTRQPIGARHQPLILTACGTKLELCAEGKGQNAAPLVLYLEEWCLRRISMEAGPMLKPFSRYLKAVEEHLPSEHHPILRNGLYLAILDWYTDGIDPTEAAARIRHAVTG